MKPENNRDKALLTLFTNENGKPSLKLVTSADADVIIESEMLKESK